MTVCLYFWGVVDPFSLLTLEAWIVVLGLNGEVLFEIIGSFFIAYGLSLWAKGFLELKNPVPFGVRTDFFMLN